MKRLIVLSIVLLLFQLIVAPPVKEQKKNDENEHHDKDKDELEDYMEYSRYLKEVVNALESDPEFRQKLEKAEEADIRSGKIAHELEYVSHRVRTRLDEIKRTEVERLRHLASKKQDLENGIDTNHLKINAVDKEHLDHANPHTFEIEDLKKLIAKTSQDLAEADKKRREEFKQYEMQKEFEKKEKLKTLDDMHRIEMEKELQDQETKHKKHEPLHHPGSKQQLEEVWEKQDHMDSQDFDPKTFFMMHDFDGNGHWDENEVKVLFLKELDKLYSQGAPEDDMRERAEEMERMREHVFSEADTNRDGLISYQEFLAQTKKPDFTQDSGWEGLDQQRVYTPEEYQEFERRRMEEVERLIAQGMLPPHPAGYPQGVPQQHPGQFPPQGQYQQNGQGQPQFYPGQVTQRPPQQLPNNGQPVYQQPAYHGQQQYQGQPNQAPKYQGHPNQVPQYQGHPNQAPQYQGYPNQAPQYQGQPNQNAQYQGQGYQNSVNQGQPNTGSKEQQQQQEREVYNKQEKLPKGQVPQDAKNMNQVPSQQFASGNPDGKAQNIPVANQQREQAPAQLPNEIIKDAQLQQKQPDQNKVPVPAQEKVPVIHNV